MPLIKFIILILIPIESGGNSLAIGDNGEAVGALQIHTIFVDEVNRILWLQGRSERFSYEDRIIVSRSIEMADIYLTFWGKKAGISDFEKLPDDDMVILGRIFNGNPSRGHKSSSTLPYAEKVITQLAKIKNK